MKIYITGLPSGYEVEHLARLFYPMAPLTLTPPEPAEDCLWAEKTDTGLRVLVRQGEKSKMLEAPLPLPVEQGGETPEFALASLTYDLLRQWTGIRPPWGKMTGVRPVRLIHDKRHRQQIRLFVFAEHLLQNVNIISDFVIRYVFSCGCGVQFTIRPFYDDSGFIKFYRSC